MISGILALTAALSLASPPAESAPTPETAALVARLARPAPADTAYAEVRFVSLLKRPLVLHGALHYGGAGELGKRVDAPYRETTTIANGDVDVERAGRSPQHFALDRAPELQVLLSAFSALLGGDAAALARFYALDLQQDGLRFTLTLTPRDAGLRRHLREFVVEGAGSEPRCFTLRQADGDESVMLLGALAAAKLPSPPTRAALATLCRNAAQ